MGNKGNKKKRKKNYYNVLTKINSWWETVSIFIYSLCRFIHLFFKRYLFYFIFIFFIISYSCDCPETMQYATFSKISHKMYFFKLRK
jgi:hypothetical protein